jgi:hypothetical protein
VSSIDVLVLADDSIDADLVSTVAAGRPIGVVLARDLGPDVEVPVERPPPGSSTVAVGALELHLDALPDRIVVEAAPRGSGADAG